ncbi:phage/plasmid primase, P4 family [Arthrobacter flavus]|uniref:Phage/plasmid primase, P4 family n=1 Tax=Arthrobacter flavus TaxID=95172 RepID=A0ABW4Q9X5_9MICC
MSLENLSTLEELQAEAERFYTALFERSPRSDSGYIAIKRARRVTPSDPESETKPAKTLWLPLNCGPTAYAEAVLESLKYDEVYTSVTPHTEITTKFGSQGTRTTLCPTQILHFDLDSGKEGTPESQDELVGLALEVFGGAKLPIHLLVSSGQGLHAYTHLESPLVLPAQQELLLRAAEWIRAEFESRGFSVDHGVTSDAARILRPAGSLHKKDPASPKVVRVLSEDAAPPVALSRLDDLFPSVDITRPGARIPVADDNRPGTQLSLRLDVRRAIEALGWSLVSAAAGTEKWTANLKTAASHLNGDVYLNDDLPKLYIYSETTAAHFGLRTKAGYTSFALVALLLCAGDFKLATRLAYRFMDTPEKLLDLLKRFGTADAPQLTELLDLARSNTSAWPAGLTKRHRVYLTTRGVSPDVAAGRGYKSLAAGEQPKPKKLKFTATADAIQIPVHRLGGEVMLEARFDEPYAATDAKGKVASAILSQKSANHRQNGLDVHPDCAPALSNTSLDLAVVVAEASFAAPVEFKATPHYASVDADAVLSAARRENLDVAVCSAFSWSRTITPLGSSTGQSSGAVLASCWDGVPLAGRRVYLIGREHWQKAFDLVLLAKLLSEAGADVRFVSVPRTDRTAAPTSGSASVRSVGDYLASSVRSSAPLTELLAAALPLEEASFRSHTLVADDASRYRHSAEALIKGGVFLFDATNQKWMINKGAHFATDLAQTPRRALLDLLERDYLDVSRTHYVTDAVKACQQDERLARTVEQLETPESLLNTPAGVLDLTSGKTRPRVTGDAYTQVTGASVVPDYSGIVNSSFERFMEETFRSDQELIGYMQLLLGMAMFGFNPEILALCLGSGRNGKSVLWQQIARLLGTYAAFAPSALLSGEGKEHQYATLQGIRLLIASETNEGTVLDSVAVKELTKTDGLPAAKKYGQPFTVTPRYLTVLMTNFEPTIRVSDPGTWDRIKLIPFNNYVREEDRDRTLPGKLWVERDLIFSWMAEGARLISEKGFVLPRIAAIDSATDRYRQDQDLLGSFITEQVVLDPNHKVKRSTLTEAIGEWLKAEQGLLKPWSTPHISKELTQRKDKLGIQLAKVNGEFHWLGMGLRAAVGAPGTDRSNVRELHPVMEAARHEPPPLAATGTEGAHVAALHVPSDTEITL